MSECPQPRLQALRWAFQQTLQATAKLPSFSEFQSHFPGQEVPQSFREALYELYAQFLKAFQNNCMDGFEQVLRTYDVPQVLHNLDEAENCGNPAAAQIAETGKHLQHARCAMLKSHVQKLQDLLQQKRTRIAALKEARASLEQQKLLDDEALDILADWNDSIAHCDDVQGEDDPHAGNDLLVGA